MHISRFVKAILYLAVTVLLLVLSASLQMAMHTEGGLENAYFRSSAYIFITAVACLGTAIYSYKAFTKRHSEHKADSLFFFLTGLLLTVSALGVLVFFGGLSSPFGQTGYTAANVNILLMTLIPLPFFIRGAVLAFSTHSESRAQRGGILLACGIVAAAYIAALAGGAMMRMVNYQTDSSYSAGAVNQADEDSQVA